MIVKVAPVLGWLALTLLLFSGFGCRLGFWGYQTGFLLLFIAAVLVVITLLIILCLAFKQSTGAGDRQFLFPCLIAVIVIAVPVSQVVAFKSLPVIHDISTDTINPPQFVDLVALRAGATNPPEYLAGDVARQQLQAYPTIKTLYLDVSQQQVFASAERVIGQLGWHLVASDAAAGRLEATDTTFWFGFKDDIVIRIRTDNSVVKVDLRSKSRVGKSDLGANARRIGKFVRSLKSTI